MSILIWCFVVLVFPRSVALGIMILVLILNLLIVLRLFEKKLKFFYQFVYILERRKNLQKPGIQAIWANLGVFLSFLLFGKCAIPGIVALAVGDAFSTLIGIRYGKRKFINRSLEGSLGFVVPTFLTLLPFYGFYKAILFALVGAFTEIISKKVDDNFSIPLAVSFVCFILSRYL